MLNCKGESITMNKLISVIVLVYNNSIYLPSCLASICSQNYEEIELIIGDDKSDDFSLQSILNIISNLANTNIKAVTVYSNEKNYGIVHNYIKALSYTKGEYIFYLAADDTLYDTMVLKDIYKAFSASSHLILTGYRKCFDNLGKQFIRPRKEEADILKYGSISQKYSRIVQKNIIAGANTPFHRSLINEFQNIKKYIYLEDWPRYLSLFEQNIDIGFVNRILVSYRLGGLTSKHNNALLQKDYNLLFSKNMPLENIRKLKECQFLIGIIDFSDSTQMVVALEKLLGRNLDEIITYQNINSLDDYNDTFFILIFSSSMYYYIAKQLEEKGLAESKDFMFINEEKIQFLRQCSEKDK